MVQWLSTSQILRNKSRMAIKSYHSLLKLVNSVDYAWILTVSIWLKKKHYKLPFLIVHSFSNKNEPWEFPLWHNGIGGISGALGCRPDPWPAQHSELRIWHCCSCSIGCNCSSDLIPSPGTPYAVGQPKKEKKKEPWMSPIPFQPCLREAAKSWTPAFPWVNSLLFNPLWP